MTLILSVAEYRQLHQRKTKQNDRGLFLEDFETIYQKPDCLQQSDCTSCTKLMPGVCLYILNWHYRREMVLKVPVCLHPIQSLILASEFISFDIYPTLGGKRSYFSGSGISPAFVEKYRRLPKRYAESEGVASQHISGINIQIEPKVLIELFADLLNEREDLIELLLNPDKPKTSFFPEVTRSMLAIVKQITNVPFHGAIKKIYLQGKVLELLALHHETIFTKQNRFKSSKLRSRSIDRIYYAKDILDNSYKNPPSIIQLARIGVSESDAKLIL